MKKIKINTEFITLSQLLKMENIVSSGGEAKYFLSNNCDKIFLNGKLESRRGKKLYKNDSIVILNKEYLIE